MLNKTKINDKYPIFRILSQMVTAAHQNKIYDVNSTICRGDGIYVCACTRILFDSDII